MDEGKPIEKVWNLFNGSLKDLQKIMSQVVSHKSNYVSEEKIDTIYRQQFHDSKRMM